MKTILTIIMIFESLIAVSQSCEINVIRLNHYNEFLDNPGEIDIKVSAHDSYKIYWSDNNSSSTKRKGLLPSFYEVSVTDSTGCSIKKSIEIKDYTRIKAKLKVKNKILYVKPIGADVEFIHVYGQKYNKLEIKDLSQGMNAVLVKFVNGTVRSYNIEIK